MSDNGLKNPVRYSACLGSKMAFEEVLRLIENGTELQFLKYQMIVNIHEFEKQLETLTNEID